MVQSRQWILAKKASALPTYSGEDANFQLKTVDLPEPKDGEILIKPKYLSNDPAQRGWINAETAAERLYVAPVEIGTPMRARGLAEVIESKSESYKKGEWVFATAGWTEYAVLNAKDVQPAPDLGGGLPRTVYLGALGTVGMTAYFGLLEVAKCTKADDVVVVSGAAGATGNVVVQIAKKLVGCKKVIGIAGSDDKCRWVEKLGADICLNYKDADFAEKLRKETPGPDGFANVYFDNVGGEILDLILTRMARNGRITACGAISDYNNSSDKMTGLKNWFEVISMRLNIKGFICADYVEQWPAAREVLRKMVGDGKLELEGGEHVVKGSFEDVPKTWLHLFEGRNQGKLITEIE